MNKSSSVLESSFIIEDEESMVAFGGKLAEALMPGLTLALMYLIFIFIWA